MFKCSECGHDLQENIVFCGGCGFSFFPLKRMIKTLSLIFGIFGIIGLFGVFAQTGFMVVWSLVAGLFTLFVYFMMYTHYGKIEKAYSLEMLSYAYLVMSINGLFIGITEATKLSNDLGEGFTIVIMIFSSIISLAMPMLFIYCTTKYKKIIDKE